MPDQSGKRDPVVWALVHEAHRVGLPVTVATHHSRSAGTGHVIEIDDDRFWVLDDGVRLVFDWSVVAEVRLAPSPAGGEHKAVAEHLLDASPPGPSWTPDFTVDQDPRTFVRAWHSLAEAQTIAAALSACHLDDLALSFVQLFDFEEDDAPRLYSTEEMLAVEDREVASGGEREARLDGLCVSFCGRAREIANALAGCNVRQPVAAQMLTDLLDDVHAARRTIASSSPPAGGEGDEARELWIGFPLDQGPALPVVLTPQNRRGVEASDDWKARRYVPAPAPAGGEGQDDERTLREIARDEDRACNDHEGVEDRPRPIYVRNVPGEGQDAPAREDEATREPTRAEAALLQLLGFTYLDHLGWLNPDGNQMHDDGSLEEALDEACATVELGDVEIAEGGTDGD